MIICRTRPCLLKAIAPKVKVHKDIEPTKPIHVGLQASAMMYDNRIGRFRILWLRSIGSSAKKAVQSISDSEIIRNIWSIEKGF
jgi:hypothetical protein